jgi:hypothetical protein
MKGEQAKPHQDTEIYEKKYSDVHFSSDATHGILWAVLRR